MAATLCHMSQWHRKAHLVARTRARSLQLAGGSTRGAGASLPEARQDTQPSAGVQELTHMAGGTATP